MQADVKIYRGRSLEDVLPQVREELGPEAVVLRQREGLGGGVGGFFQRRFVEIEARGPLASDAGAEELRGPGAGQGFLAEPRTDRATAEGLESPAIQALVEQAQPFAQALARAESRVADRADAVLTAAARGAVDTTTDLLGSQGARASALPAWPEPSDSATGDSGFEPLDPAALKPLDAGLYGPQPNPPAVIGRRELLLREAFVAHGGAPEATSASPSPGASPAGGVGPLRRALAEASGAVLPGEAAAPPETGAPSGPRRPPAADAAEQRLVDAGLSAALAADLVGEAVAHGFPFGGPRGLKKLVRLALARRLNALAAVGGGPRRVALVGAGGAGKSMACGHLAAAYAAAGASVALVALRAPDEGRGLAARLQAAGVSVVPASDAATAKARLAGAQPLLTLVDAPAVAVADTAGIAALAADLEALGVEEVHLALPATLSAPAADELVSAMSPLGLTHLALTHADETSRPGAPVELAAQTGQPLSYVCSLESVAPADPLALAQRLLP